LIVDTDYVNIGGKMIQIIKKDLKRNFVVIIILSILIICYIYYYIVYHYIPVFEYEYNIKIDLFNFNLIIIDTGYFTLFVYLISIFSSLILSSEIDLRIIEFLYSLGISRKKIFISKLIFISIIYLFSIFIFNLFLIIFSYYKFNKIDYVFLIKYLIINIPLVFFISSISFFASLFIIKRLISMGFVIFLIYFMSFFSVMCHEIEVIKNEKLINILKYISPGELLFYTKFPILFYKENNINFIIYSIPVIIISIIFVVLSYIRFEKMDFNI